jgi:hypothetical protein
MTSYYFFLYPPSAGGENYLNTVFCVITTNIAKKD